MRTLAESLLSVLNQKVLISKGAQNELAAATRRTQGKAVDD
jgi:hypothetical protein